MFMQPHQEIRTIQWPTVNSEEGCTINLINRIRKEVSILFGREDRGLTNEELQLANTHIEIPANPEYPVLKLSYVSSDLCYEIFKASHQQKQEIGMTILRSILKTYKC